MKRDREFTSAKRKNLAGRYFRANYHSCRNAPDSSMRNLAGHAFSRAAIVAASSRSVVERARGYMASAETLAIVLRDRNHRRNVREGGNNDEKQLRTITIIIARSTDLHLSIRVYAE